MRWQQPWMNGKHKPMGALHVETLHLPPYIKHANRGRGIVFAGLRLRLAYNDTSAKNHSSVCLRVFESASNQLPTISPGKFTPGPVRPLGVLSMPPFPIKVSPGEGRFPTARYWVVRLLHKGILDRDKKTRTIDGRRISGSSTYRMPCK